MVLGCRYAESRSERLVDMIDILSSRYESCVVDFPFSVLVVRCEMRVKASLSIVQFDLSAVFRPTFLCVRVN